MKVIDLIRNNDKTAFSFEVLPPLKGSGTSTLFENIDKLKEFNPKYINITNHRSEVVYRQKQDETYLRDTIRKRPGTVAIAAAIQKRYGVTVVPHIICSGFTKADTEYLLLDLQFLGITDLLVLRGDKAREDSMFKAVKDGHSHATELIGQINQFNKGFFIDGEQMKVKGEPFSYGVACYPEKHEEAPNMESDIAYLKRKVELGAEYAVTQMFFDNKKYFEFLDRALLAGINIPIIPGIKPFSKLSQLTVVPKTFHLDLPEELAKEAAKCTNDEQAKALGIEWCEHQCRDLIAHGVPSIHFYTVSAFDSIREVAKRIY